MPATRAHRREGRRRRDPHRANSPSCQHRLQQRTSCGPPLFHFCLPILTVSGTACRCGPLACSLKVRSGRRERFDVDHRSVARAARCYSRRLVDDEKRNHHRPCGAVAIDFHQGCRASCRSPDSCHARVRRSASYLTCVNGPDRRSVGVDSTHTDLPPVQRTIRRVADEAPGRVGSCYFSKPNPTSSARPFQCAAPI